MCGIVGYIGKEQAAPILLEGLARLEYRGYDSAGMAVRGPEGLMVQKAKGRLQALADLTREGKAMPGTIGIGHTRWATHGEPNDVNAHPQVSQSGTFAVVHNGIIENYAELKNSLLKKGYTFRSETDTEVVAQLLDWYYRESRDVFEAVQMSVNPKVINTPPVAAVAKDGIQLIAKARVTVRANIKQLVGGAGEETVLARVGEGIVSSIGSAASHKIVLENPDSISRVVLEKGLDAGTAFEILSIDIADIDVGKNIGAQLQMDQAQADKNIAQAKAEERRAMAVALEQENKAKAQDARAKVILAEAEVPLAMAEAFRNGNLGIMDYYKMKNIMADTQMRETIAKPEKK